jgi:hypothetical protein
MTITYYINGVTFSSLGVGVSQSKGIIDGLKFRDLKKMTWPDHHGEVVDLSAPRYEAREISLECFIKAATATAFILAMQNFLEAFQKAGLQQLILEVNDGVSTRKPLIYMVYMDSGVELTKKWSAASMSGSFTLKLREPEPVKRVYSFTAAAGAMTASVAVTTTEPVNIYWGDTAVTYDVTTASGAATHTYATAGVKYIVITGVIEDITGVTTGATLIWSRL